MSSSGRAFIVVVLAAALLLVVGVFSTWHLPGEVWSYAGVQAPESALPTPGSPSWDLLGFQASITTTAGLTSTQPAPSPTPSALQLRVFEDLWGTVKKNYLYRDFNGVPWDFVHTVYKNRITAGMRPDDFYAAMGEMIGMLNDDHSHYFSPPEVNKVKAEESGKTDYVGIGIISKPVPERKYMTIMFVLPDSPAEEYGLNVHDNILSVDGIPIYNGKDYQADLMRGKEGTNVILEVQTFGQNPRYVMIPRKKIQSSVPVPYRLMKSPSGKRVGYILITNFMDQAVGNKVRAAIKEMSQDGNLDGLIIDNRINPGGASGVVFDVLNMFLRGFIGSFVVRGEVYPVVLNGQNYYGSLKVPMVVLIGPDSASFGETSAAILKDSGRAYLIGLPTMGNVEVLLPYDFADGSAAWIAEGTFRLAKHPKERWEGTGVQPDLRVITIWDQVTPDTDPAIRSALIYFDGK
jgi:C-terminal peptidase prc